MCVCETSVFVYACMYLFMNYYTVQFYLENSLSLYLWVCVCAKPQFYLENHFIYTVYIYFAFNNDLV